MWGTDLFHSMICITLAIAGLRSDPVRAGMQEHPSDSAFVAAMQPSVAAIHDAPTPEDLQALYQAFDGLATRFPRQWLPRYYQAHAAVLLSLEREGADARQWLDRAQAHLDQTEGKDPDEAECTALQVMIQTGRVRLSPMMLGPTLVPQSFRMLDQALQKHPDHPRLYYLKGLNLYHMPAFFGGGCAAALPLLQTAQDKFQTYDSPGPLHPHWGREQNLKLLKDCQAHEG